MMRVSRIRRPNALILAAWIIQLAAWLIPVLTVLDVPMRGWETFIVTLSVFWPSKDVVYGAWYDPWLMGVSTITTLAFVVGSPWIVFRGSRSAQDMSAWIAGGAFVLNTHWYIFSEVESVMSKLQIGYFFWWFSFAVLALGLFDLARNGSDPAKARPQVNQTS